MNRHSEHLGVYNKGGMSMINTVLVVLIIILIAGAGFFYITTMRSGSFEDALQIVVLDTGEVFIGEVQKNNDSEILLTNVYFLPVAADDLFSEVTNARKDALSVIKIGNEVHGPEDIMYITKEHVVYVQNLREDSTILAAIREYQQ